MSAGATPLDIDLDLAATPFSRSGSYFGVSRYDGPGHTGIFLRTVRGAVRHREIAQLLLGDDPAPGHSVTAGRLRLESGPTVVEIALAEAGTALLRIEGGPLTIALAADEQYDVVLQEGRARWRFIDSGANRNYSIRIEGATGTLEAEWDGVRNRDARLRIVPDDDRALVVVEEFESSAPVSSPMDFDATRSSAEADFAKWHHAHVLRGRSGFSAARTLAGYVMWSATVPPGGLHRRSSILMSKNGMTNVWSWDHCFNALALWRDPEAALDQILTVFDHQDRHGCLPDYVNDAEREWNFVKPPVHGWALQFLMDRGAITTEALADIYHPLARWTRWWFAHRDYTGDGIPSYNHGNDSGWDNSTAFQQGTPVQSPDLIAFLAVQARSLGTIATRLENSRDARSWHRRSEELVEMLLREFWVDGRFVARDTLTHRPAPSTSLLTLMPLVLGDLLPEPYRASVIEQLLTGGYLTEHGLATEPPESEHYRADGYWRGPIWAPPTLLLVDGLARAGRDDLALEIARRFCTTCAAAGMAENFDALTGAGLRDRSYTWTAAVFLLLSDLVDRADDAAGPGR